MSDLARRLAAHPRFIWAPGMKIADYGPGIRYCWQDETHLHGAAEEGGAWTRLPKSRIGSGAYLPDLTDAGTAGVVLSWLPPGVFVRQSDAPIGDPDVWSVGTTTSTGRGRSLGEAAARAVLAWWSEVSDER
jgi:hypothetical protein